MMKWTKPEGISGMPTLKNHTATLVGNRVRSKLDTHVWDAEGREGGCIDCAILSSLSMTFLLARGF
jgi:hypothetical protein